MFNEIHRNRIPGLLRNWQLLEQAIGFMLLGLVVHANGAGFAVVFDKTSDARPGEISLNHFKGFCSHQSVQTGCDCACAEGHEVVDHWSWGHMFICCARGNCWGSFATLGQRCYRDVLRLLGRK